MNKYLGYGTIFLALIALVVSLVALGSVGDEAMTLHPGYTIATASTWGGDGTGYDVTWNSETAGDFLLWDASDVALEITGTAAQDALNVADGNVSIVDDLDVDGTTNLDAVDVDDAVQIDGTVTVGVSGTGKDVIFHSDTATEEVTWDASEEQLILDGVNATTVLNVSDGNVSVTDDLAVDGTANLDDVDIDLSAAMKIDGHLLDIGTGTYTLADADNDLGVQGTFEVNGAAELDSTLTVRGATTHQADVTISNSSGNAGDVNQYTGVPKLIPWVDAAGANGTSSVKCIDTTPAGEWAAVTADGIVVTADTSIYRHTTNSVKVAVTDAADNEGVDGTIVEDDFSGAASLGFWIYSTVSLASGDMDLTLDDTDGTDQVYDVGVVTADTWTWVELDISGCDANCNTVDGIHVLFTVQGAAAITAVDVYLDGMYVWDAASEVALGQSVLNDGVVAVFSILTADAQGAVVLAAEHTDYIVHYESGVDFLVYLTDQSQESLFALLAVE